MIEWARSLLETASLFGVFRLLSSMSATDIVFVFLCSKPLFVFLAVASGIRAHLADGGTVVLPDGSRKKLE